MLTKIRSFVSNLAHKEPLVVVNTAAAALTAVVAEVRAFVVDAQGGLEGRHAWLAVAWAAFVFVSRRFVSPAATAEP